jgi:hypothetical protein
MKNFVALTLTSMAAHYLCLLVASLVPKHWRTTVLILGMNLNLVLLILINLRGGVLAAIERLFEEL